MNIYVASSWRNHYQPEVVRTLRGAGHEVYDFRNPAPGDKGFNWEEIDPNWRKWDGQQFCEGLEHPIAQNGFQRDLIAMTAASVCVLSLPCGRKLIVLLDSEEVHRVNGHTCSREEPCTECNELWCHFAESPLEAELMYLMADAICIDLPGVVVALDEWSDRISI
jgi:hypothetical protein